MNWVRLTSSLAPTAAARATCWRPWECSPLPHTARSTTRVSSIEECVLGFPRLYKSAFPAKPGKKIPSHLFFRARSARAKYEVSLHNPLNDPAPAWRFKTELWEDTAGQLVGRSPATKTRSNPERGMAALESVRAIYTLFLAVISGHRHGPRLCAVDNADHDLNPRLSRSLIAHLCAWYLDASRPRQILLTTHNPLVLDGLPLQDDRVRLFTVSRTNSGRTSVRRVEINDGLAKKAEQGWSLSRLWVMGHLGGVPDV